MPLAVQAFDEAALEASGVDDVIDLNLASPSFFVNSLQERTGNTPVRIRGIGTVAPTLVLKALLVCISTGFIDHARGWR